MSIQQDVMDTIGPEGVEKAQLRDRVGNVGQRELDQVIQGLMRGGRVREVSGRYELTDSTPREASAPITPTPSNATTPEKSSYCTGCKTNHPVSAFQRTSLGNLFNQCKEFRRGVISEAMKGAHRKKRAGNGPEATVSVETDGSVTVRGVVECNGSLEEAPRNSVPGPKPDPVYEVIRSRLEQTLEQIAALQEEVKAMRIYLSVHDRYAREPA